METIPEATQPATERVIAPEVPAYQPPAPRQMRVERQGSSSEPYTRRFPQIRGGICEYCGVLDRNVPSKDQYKLCPHYRGMEARCTYCPPSKNPDETVYHAAMNVAEHPDRPGVLIMWCDETECAGAHIKRFQRASA